MSRHAPGEIRTEFFRCYNDLLFCMAFCALPFNSDRSIFFIKEISQRKNQRISHQAERKRGNLVVKLDMVLTPKKNSSMGRKMGAVWLVQLRVPRWDPPSVTCSDEAGTMPMPRKGVSKSSTCRTVPRMRISGATFDPLPMFKWQGS